MCECMSGISVLRDQSRDITDSRPNQAKMKDPVSKKTKNKNKTKQNKTIPSCGHAWDADYKNKEKIQWQLSNLQA